jgi:hypothetical protein
MHPYLLEQAAAQHTAELRASSAAAVRASAVRASAVQRRRHPLRRRTGWALVSVGLWLATGRA